MADRLTDTSVPDPPSDELLHQVGLTRDEYEHVCDLLKRKPNLVEMGIFGAMWSEHCCYKSSKRHLAKLPTEGTAVLQGPGENAGVMDLGGDYAVVFKIESHNHPSAVEPFQGAATGVGGIIRDIFAMGARPIAVLDSLRFGDLQPVAPVGGMPDGYTGEEAPAEAEEEDAASAGHEGATPAGPTVAWNDEPKPYVCTIGWLTNMRRPLFMRAPVARRAVEEIRKLHEDMGRILAYCVMPDQVLLAVSFPGGSDSEAATLVAVLKANLADAVKDALPPGERAWEEGFRLHPKYDDGELAEAIMRLEYTPVQRGTVKQIKNYPYVSAVWKYGLAWPEGAEIPRQKPVPLPACPGVTQAQAARNRYLLSGVVSGIAHYGNCIGIPTVGGEVVFDPSYSNNCLVNVMCVGVVRKDALIRALATGPGNTALIVGAKTGRDGVQGATFASVDLPEDYASERPAVQVGDPFMEKLLLEATLEIQHLPGLIGVQDFGAAGLTCSGVEMAARAGTGMRLDLDKVPQRAADLTAYEMMLSESQERMMVVVRRGEEQPFLDVFDKWGLTAVPCGEVLPDKWLRVLHQGQEVAKLPNKLLGDDAPDYDRPAAEPDYSRARKPANDVDIELALERACAQPSLQLDGQTAIPPADSREEEMLRRLLAGPAIAGKHVVYRQYDYMVRTNTLLGPGSSDAAVMRIKETGQGLALATDGSGRHVLLDPRLGGARAVLESARNVLAVGAKPLGITNCLNFGNPEKPDRMWHFAQCIEGMRESLGELELPVTGGNVSFYNETAGQGVLPTPVIGMVGLLDKAEQYVPSRASVPNLELYVLGQTDGRLDGSALLFELGRFRTGKLAPHDYREFRECERFLIQAADQGALTACHDVSDGGLLTALVELCATGARIDLGERVPENYDAEEHNRLAALFGEEGHRWILAVTQEQRTWIRTAAFHYSVPLVPLGQTCEGVLSVSAGGKLWFECPWEPLGLLQRDGLSTALKD